MIKRNRKYIFSNVLMLIELIALGTVVAVFVWVYNRYVHQIPFALIASVNSIILVGIFYGVRFYYRYTMKQYIETMSQGLDGVFGENGDHGESRVSHGELCRRESCAWRLASTRHDIPV